jgi:hypothetical protein
MLDWVDDRHRRRPGYFRPHCPWRGGAVAILTAVSTQRLQVNAFPVFDWMKEFFGLCVSRARAGLRGSRVICADGRCVCVQGCRAFKIRGVRKLGKLADAVPGDLAQAFILFSKTGTFSAEEVALARTLNGEYRRRVILWSGGELEPYFLYERSKERLGGDEHAVSLADMANVMHRLYFA